jgi:hypothetical protein
MKTMNSDFVPDPGGEERVITIECLDFAACLRFHKKEATDLVLASVVYQWPGCDKRDRPALQICAMIRGVGFAKGQGTRLIGTENNPMHDFEFLSKSDRIDMRLLNSTKNPVRLIASLR